MMKTGDEHFGNPKQAKTGREEFGEFLKVTKRSVKWNNFLRGWNCANREN